MHTKVPGALFHYWNQRADMINSRFSDMSERQRDKIEQAMLKDPQRAADSEVFRAMERDVAFSGRAAFFDPS